MGVTTGFGNTTARQAAENSLRLIRLAGVPYDCLLYTSHLPAGGGDR